MPAVGSQAHVCPSFRFNVRYKVSLCAPDLPWTVNLMKAMSSVLSTLFVGARLVRPDDGHLCGCSVFVKRLFASFPIEMALAYLVDSSWAVDAIA